MFGALIVGALGGEDGGGVLVMVITRVVVVRQGLDGSDQLTGQPGLAHPRRTDQQHAGGARVLESPREQRELLGSPEPRGSGPERSIGPGRMAGRLRLRPVDAASGA